MPLFEIMIKDSGSLEKDVVKVCFQIVEILGYVALLHYFLQYKFVFSLKYIIL